MQTLRQGDEGRSVRILQTLLVGETGEAIPNVGVFDQRTKLVLMQHQRLHGYTQNFGEAGPETWEYLLFGKKKEED